MTLVKWNNLNEIKHTSLDPFFDHFFNNNFDGLNESLALGTTIPAVNIVESDNSFELEVAAPGLKKDQFNVDFEDNVLTISAESIDEQEFSDKPSRREFNYSSFARSFSLPENISQDQIDVDYINGVLKITIHKQEKFKQKTLKNIMR